MNRKKKILNNVLSTGIQQVIIVLCNFFIMKLIIETYGTEINGLYNFLLQLFNYFKLIEGGITAAAIFALYKPLSEKNNFILVSILRLIGIRFKKIAAYFALLVLALGVTIPYIFSVEGYNEYQIFMIVIILGLGTCIDFLWVIKERILLTADQKIYVISYVNSFYNILQLLLIILISSNEGEFLTIWILNILLVLGKAWILNWYNTKQYNLDYVNFTENVKVTQQGSAIYNQILGAIQISSPILLTTILFNNLFLTSLISVYLLVTTGINKIFDVFKSGIYPFFGVLIAGENATDVRKYYNIFEVIYLIIINVVGCSALYLINPFVELYLDEKYVIYSLGMLMCLDVISYNLKIPLGTLIIASGKFKETRVQVTIQAIIILAGGVILGLYYGILGIVIASIIANLYRLIDMIYFVNKFILKNIFISSFKRIVITIVAVVSNIIILNSVEIEINIWSEWFYLGLLVFTLNLMFINLLYIISNRSEYKEIIKFLLKVVSR